MKLSLSANAKAVINEDSLDLKSNLAVTLTRRFLLLTALPGGYWWPLNQGDSIFFLSPPVSLFLFKLHAMFDPVACLVLLGSILQ